MGFKNLQELVFMLDGEPRTSSEIIAEGTLNDNSSVVKLIRKYEYYLKEFGLITYSNSKQLSGQSKVIGFLNEKQTAFLLTLMRNNEIVINFKMNLIKAFYAMELSNRHLLTHQETPKTEVFTLNKVLEETLPIGFGVMYALEYGNYLKIGHSTNPKRRVHGLKHQAEKYSGTNSMNYALSINMTNYLEVESYLHNYFADIRKEGTELFKMTLNSFLLRLPKLEIKTDNNHLVEKLSLVSNNIHNFILKDRRQQCN